MKKLNKKQNWGFDLKSVEGDVDSLIHKYRRPDIATNTVVQIKVDELPEEGFMLVMISRRGDKITMRQFGRDMDTEAIEEGFFKILNSLYLPKEDEKIGIA